MAKKRMVRRALKNVHLLNCDAHELPFPMETFDAVVAESMLVFCDANMVFRQAYRTLKKDGIFAINELTLLSSPPKDLMRWFWDLFHIRPFFKDDWMDLFKQTGFVNIKWQVHSIEFQDDFVSHVRIDGITRYASSILKSLINPSLRSTFFSRDTLQAMIKFLPYIGYGLFTGRKQ